MTSNARRPILSFCMTARDDDYTSDFKYRLETTLEYLAMSVRESGHQGKVEAIVADWGGARPLRDVVQLSADACEIASFVTVPRATMLELQQGQDFFSTARGFNVAIRRAAGAYRGLCGADILIPRHTVDIMVNALESGAAINAIRPDAALLYCTRKKIPWDVVRRQPSVPEWRRFLHANAWMLNKDDCLAPGFLSGNASVLMMHAALWQEFGGLRESMTGWGWSDVELTLRVSGYYPWLDLTGLGVEVFDLAHQGAGDRRSEEMRAPNKYEVNAGPDVNGPDWGLGDLDLEISRATPRPAIRRPRPGGDAAGALERAGRHVGDKLTAMLQNEAWVYDLHTDDEEMFLSVVCVVAAELNEPSVIIDIGASKACPSATTLALHRWTEYVGVDRWLGSCDGIGQPTRLGYLLYSSSVGFVGRGTFVPNPETLPLFLARSGFPAADLVIFRAAVFKDEALAAGVFRTLCDMLSPEGLIVVRHPPEGRWPLDTGSADIVVQDEVGLQISLVFRRASLAVAAIGWQAPSIRAVARAIPSGFAEPPIRRRFGAPFLKRIVEMPAEQTLVVGGYGIYGRALVAYLQSLEAERFRFDRLVVWDNVKDRRELTTIGFRCYAPDEHDEWPAADLLAITPLNNDGMVAQLMALLMRHMTRTGKTRLVVGGLDANRTRALQILGTQPDIVAGRIELLSWAGEGDAEDVSNASWKTWTPENGPFPAADTLVWLPSISSDVMRERLERLDGRRGDSFIDNVLWHQLSSRRAGLVE